MITLFVLPSCLQRSNETELFACFRYSPDNTRLNGCDAIATDVKSTRKFEKKNLNPSCLCLSVMFITPLPHPTLQAVLK